MGPKEMHTYSITDSRSERPFAFEVENAYVGPRTIARLLSTVRGVSDLRRRKCFRGSSEVHVQFTYRGRAYIVWEPYGDSSRYWIGPDEAASEHDDVSDLEDAFRQHRPSLARRIMGGMLSLDWVARLAGSEKTRRPQ